ncbi:MerR HTH family regulatory protein [Thermodesulfobium acidiphilum]|uniref:MerR HTH family regulatory protein n=1 Tax=Thermodesulfobium acidiphilum TaxID=1794699 RepID=A0A2R4W083_THEAF|nr:MerR family transcriptional regulator [Thermodesulfobium acidiphilum]AWB10185.1 MerR HTH family regulatory protein [Thermodesulfobium acidiphilum]
MENYITLEQLSKETNIAESTIRRYINKFESLFDINNEKRSKRYNKSCIPQLIKINEMYKKGFTTEEIKKSLNIDVKNKTNLVNKNKITNAQLESFICEKKCNTEESLKNLLLKQILLLEEIKDNIKVLEDIDSLKGEVSKKEVEIANLKRENFELKEYLNRLEEKINSYEKELNKLKKESDNTLMELFNNLKLEQNKEGQKSWWKKLFPK